MKRIGVVVTAIALTMMCTLFLSAVASSKFAGFVVGNSSQKRRMAAAELVIVKTSPLVMAQRGLGLEAARPSVSTENGP